MNVLFVNCSNFLSNGAIQMFHLANALIARGHGCACVVPSGKETVRACGDAHFTAYDFADVRAGMVPFPDGRGPDLVHAWTPREGVRKLVLELAARFACPYYVHLEDNEDVVTAALTGLSYDGLLSEPDEVIDPRIGDAWSHPRRFRAFLAQARGVTALIDRLLEFVPPEVPSQVFWPGYNEALFKPQRPDHGLRRALGIPDDRFVVTYNGNAHPANAGEMRSLYLAIGLLNRSGRNVTLLRCGVDGVDFLGDVRPWVERHVVALGSRPHVEQPRYLALADALVQPGRADPFNDYRFPSKLPEFFAMARPVILPHTNIGRYLTDGEHCLLLQDGHCRDITAKLVQLMDAPDLRARLAEAGHRFGSEHLRWLHAAEAVEALYQRTLHADARARATTPELAGAERIAARYATYRPAPLSYATVEDFCDSLEQLPSLASVNRDLKDAQRPWVVKAICGAVPRGGRLLEIGGGDPLVADLLSRMGYEVTIIDPYDGRDNGPADFARIRDAYPHVRFVRGIFPDDVPAGDPDYDCIYSISVLEHVAVEDVPRLVEGIRRLTRGPSGMTIHAIDHVHRGPGAAEHLAKLERIVEALGFAPGELASLLSRLDTDTETYFLSAEAHNMWRGAIPYRSFPMRRCPSIQLCVPVGAIEPAADDAEVAALEA